MRRLLAAAVALAGVAALVAVAALSQPPLTTGPGLRVVAAESVWGSVAAQLGGGRAHVTSVVASPATDPHDYEPTALDARALATAQLAIVNGIGYDPWAAKLLAASPARGRIVVAVGDVVRLGAGGNPHRWYSPPDVLRVARAISAAYARLDPRHRAYFARERARFEHVRLAPYLHELAAIRRRYRGVRVGASESIFAPLARALGLRLVTPPSFLDAVSEGAEPTAQDVAAVQRQLSAREVAVWIYNSQNSTPDVQRLTRLARARGIPVATVTETLQPRGATFEAWQAAQLAALQRALARATGR